MPPTAFSSPTRRAYSDRRRPTRTATLATASSASSSAPGWSTPCPSWTSSASSDAVPPQVETAKRGRVAKGTGEVLEGKRLGVTGMGELEVEGIGVSGFAGDVSPVASAPVIQTWPTSSELLEFPAAGE